MFWRRDKTFLKFKCSCIICFYFFTDLLPYPVPSFSQACIWNMPLKSGSQTSLNLWRLVHFTTLSQPDKSHRLSAVILFCGWVFIPQASGLALLWPSHKKLSWCSQIVFLPVHRVQWGFCVRRYCVLFNFCIWTCPLNLLKCIMMNAPLGVWGPVASGSLSNSINQTSSSPPRCRNGRWTRVLCDFDVVVCLE